MREEETGGQGRPGEGGGHGEGCERAVLPPVHRAVHQDLSGPPQHLLPHGVPGRRRPLLRPPRDGQRLQAAEPVLLIYNSITCTIYNII